MSRKKNPYREIKGPTGQKYPAPALQWTFQSPLEFGERTSALTTREPGADRASETNDDDWAGGLTLNRTLHMLRNGTPYPEGAAMMRHVDVSAAIEASLDIHVPAIENRVQGFAPLVPAYLAGVPECMMSLEHVPARKRAIRVGAAIIHSAITTPEAIQRRGAALLSVIDALEQAGESVELWAVYRAQDSGVTASIEVLLKASGEYWDPASVAFALTHPAFGRRAGFRWLESQPGAVPVASYGYGYGAGIDYGDFDCHFGTMRGDTGYETEAQAIERTVEAFKEAIAARDAGEAPAAVA